MTPLELRIAVFTELGWTKLAIRPPAAHHWPNYPIDRDGNALTGHPPGANGLQEPGRLDLDIMSQLFNHWRAAGHPL